MIVCHLPDGPTAMFNLSSMKLIQDIEGHGKATSHKPELVLNNFSTRLGLRVGRMFGSLFCQDPTFRGRRVVTFHNQRDFVFFRHHRYIFEEKERNVVQAAVNEKTGKRKVKVTGKEAFVQTRLQVCPPPLQCRADVVARVLLDILHRRDLTTDLIVRDNLHEDDNLRSTCPA